MRADGDSFALQTASLTAGPWQADVRFAPPITAHFLLRISPDPRLAPTTLDPFLIPVGSEREVTLPLGKGTAELTVAPGSFTQENAFRVRLDGLPQCPPSIELALTMEEMDMGVTRMEATPVHPGEYLAHGSLPMGGTWQVTLIAGRMRTHALLSVGR